MTLLFGTVKSFDQTKGYGYIQNPAPKAQRDIFMHARGWRVLEGDQLRAWEKNEKKTCPQEGDQVAYELSDKASTKASALRAMCWATVPRQ